MLTIRRDTVGGVFGAPEFAALFAEYAAESAIAGLPPPKADIGLYRAMEKNGALHVISAVDEGRLVGFLNLLVTINPHYSVPLAVTESYFVGKAHRGTGAGLRLRQAAEDKARALGARGIIISAVDGSDLVAVMSHAVGYRETNRAFFRSLADV